MMGYIVRLEALFYSSLHNVLWDTLSALTRNKVSHLTSGYLGK